MKSHAYNFIFHTTDGSPCTLANLYISGLYTRDSHVMMRSGPKKSLPIHFLLFIHSNPATGQWSSHCRVQRQLGRSHRHPRILFVPLPQQESLARTWTDNQRAEPPLSCITNRFLEAQWFVSQPKLRVQPFPYLCQSCTLSISFPTISIFWTGTAKGQSSKIFTGPEPVLDERHRLNVGKSFDKSIDPSRTWVSNHLQVSYICNEDDVLLSSCKIVMLSGHNKFTTPIFRIDTRFIF